MTHCGLTYSSMFSTVVRRVDLHRQKYILDEQPHLQTGRRPGIVGTMKQQHEQTGRQLRNILQNFLL